MMFLTLYNSIFIQETPLDDDLVLGEIIEPTPIPFSFDTIGWKVVFFCIAVLFAYIIYRIYINYKKKSYLREAVAAVQNLSNKELETVTFIEGILFILKDTAIQTFGRQEVAALHGEKWLSFLDAKVANSNFKAQENVIFDVLYKNEIQPNVTFNKEEFSNKSINWIKQHAR
ncbi:DUF4381 domain-containing protein [Flavobacterium agrisoli]|uniref:DUF4381 domain-containing protein n=1 Tax=Flavobacterium agrisoli TaxID=2793066 RepID=A0A934PP77_9FLAO|nr:DUF4381 domain-containing protein [Flavobacterium agrisoli]MBK0370101.1 DUF4381 domain-containing protein [Flavobacterium agrisoli]